MAVTTPSAELERQRRLSGLKFSELARLSEVAYPRLWRFFNGVGQLSQDEEARVRAVLVNGGVAVEEHPTASTDITQTGGSQSEGGEA